MPAAQSTDRSARIKRICRRGCPEVIQALDRGALGIKTLERISRLPAEKQALELARLLEIRAAKRERQAAWETHPRRGKAFFVSQSYEEARKRRLRRIEKTAAAELGQAFHEGRLSLRRYEQLSRLSPVQQRKAVALSRHEEQAQNLAASVIHSVLAEQSSRIDLALIAGEIIAAITNSHRIEV